MMNSIEDTCRQRYCLGRIPPRDDTAHIPALTMRILAWRGKQIIKDTFLVQETGYLRSYSDRIHFYDGRPYTEDTLEGYLLKEDVY